MVHEPDSSASYPEPIALGVCDQGGLLAAIGAGDGGVYILDLGGGVELGRLDGLGTPLMIDAGRLIGRQGPEGPHRMRLFRLPLAQLQPVEWSEPVDLPEWLCLDEDGGSAPRLSFARCGTVYRLYWRGRDQNRGGAPPPGSMKLGIEQRQAARRIDFDVATLAVVAERDEDGFAEARERAERGEALARHAGALIYRQAGQLRNAPWPTEEGERYVRAGGGPADEARPIALAAAGDGIAMAAPELATRLAPGHAPELSLDGRHLAVPTEADGAPARLDIYATANGECVGSIAPPPGFGSFRLFGEKMICLGEEVSPRPDGICVLRRIHAFDIARGESLWTYDLPAKLEPDRRPLPPQMPS